MTKRLSGIGDVGKLEFVSVSERRRFLSTMAEMSLDAIKKPIAKVYETKHIKQVRLYVYDLSSWKYLLYLTCDLVK